MPSQQNLSNGYKEDHMPIIKKCKCGDEYSQYTTLQNKCPKCLARIAREKREKEERKKLKEFRIKNRRLPDWHKLTQPVFNKYIRLRDIDQPCISCGRYDHEIKDDFIRGGKFDCGHYKTVGGFPELRYEPLNAHKQCKKCNGGSGRFSHKSRSVGQDYRENLIVRIGIEKVEWLEGPHPPKHYTAEMLQEIKAKYSKLARDLEKEYENR